MKIIWVAAAAMALLGGLACGPVLAAPAEPEPVPVPAPTLAEEIEVAKAKVEIARAKTEIELAKVEAIKAQASVPSAKAKDEIGVVLQMLDQIFNKLEVLMDCL